MQTLIATVLMNRLSPNGGGTSTFLIELFNSSYWVDCLPIFLILPFYNSRLMKLNSDLLSQFHLAKEP